MPAAQCGEALAGVPERGECAQTAGRTAAAGNRAGGACCLTAGGACHASPMPTAEQQSAIKFTCRRDFIVNCRGVTPGGPDALTCLQRHAATLSQDCKTSIAAIGEAPPVAAGTSAEAAPPPRLRPVGPLRRGIRDRMMER
jgi:hypothetical protein